MQAVMEAIRDSLLDIFTLLLSIILTIFLFVGAGLDFTKLFSILSDDFSISVSLLFIISMYGIDKISNKLIMCAVGLTQKNIMSDS